jgi:hypothetical protein
VLRCAIVYASTGRVEASRDAEGLRARINDLERQLQATRTVLEQSEIRTEAMVTQQRQVSRPATEEEEPSQQEEEEENNAERVWASSFV